MKTLTNRIDTRPDLIRNLSSGAIDCVLFDLDGVLIDSTHGIHAATNYTLTQLGAQARSLTEVRRFIGNPLHEMFEDFAPGAEWETIRTYFREHSYGLIVEGSALTHFARETLETLHESGFTLLIGSTKTGEHIEGIIERLEVRNYFSAFTGGDEAQPKPAPDIFQSVLGKSQIETHRAIVVGDTINDILAARAAGVSVVTIESDLGDRDALLTHPADAHFMSLAEFMEFMSAHSPLLKNHVQR